MKSDRLKFAHIWEAYHMIRSYIYETPLEKSIYLSNHKQNVFLKLECQQPVKSFKIRGAFHKILNLSESEKSNGIIAISSGNHGIAVSYVTKILGMKKAIIIAPENTPGSKIDMIKYYGGDILLMGSNFDDAYRLGIKYKNEHNLTYIDGWDNDPDVYAGQGTAGLEILKQNPSIDTILVPIGGGGLSTGIAVAAKGINPAIKVYALYSESCTAWPDSIRDKTLYNEYPSRESVCEAMIGGIGHLSYEMQDYIDGSFMVKESFIKEAMVHAVLKEKIVAEAAGAVPIAAMLQHGEKIPGKNIALIISGGNANSDILLQEIVNYHGSRA